MKIDGFHLTWAVVIAFIGGWLVAVKRKTGAWGF
jgi:hypothetical protein